MKYQSRERQQIHCPLCQKGRVVDVAAGTDLGKVRLYGPLQAD